MRMQAMIGLLVVAGIVTLSNLSNVHAQEQQTTKPSARTFASITFRRKGAHVASAGRPGCNHGFLGHLVHSLH